MTARREVSIAIALSMLGFVIAWLVVIWLANAGVFGAVDTALGTSLYQRYGHDMLLGRFPYQGFDLEYPPLALPAFVVPALLSGGTDPLAYRTAFEATMLACGLGIIAIAIPVVAWLRAVGDAGHNRRAIVIAGAFLAAAPLLLGPVIVARFDLWPALLTIAALAVLIRDRYRLGAGLLALGILAKVYPIVLVPLLVVQAWRRAGAREAAVAGAVGALVVAIGLVPFLLLATSGTIDALRAAIDRPLQMESLGAALILVLHGVAGVAVHEVRSFGSENVAGRLPSLLVLGQTALLVVALGATWIRFGRGPATATRLVIAVAAAVTAYVALGKVLSPQYVIWLIPLVAIIPARRGRAAMAWAAAILLLTELYFPTRAFDLVDRLDPWVAGIVLVRNLALLGLAGYLVWAIDRPAGAPTDGVVVPDTQVAIARP